MLPNAYIYNNRRSIKVDWKSLETSLFVYTMGGAANLGALIKQK